MDLRGSDPLTLSYFVDADYNTDLLQKELAGELEVIYAARGVAESSLRTLSTWHSEQLRQLGRIATLPPSTREPITVDEWLKISPHQDDKPRAIKPYTPPEPAPIRYGMVRPADYRTADALTVEVKLTDPAHRSQFLQQLSGAEPITLSTGGVKQNMTYWFIFVIQSIDAAEPGRDGQLRLFVDADIDHEHFTKQISGILRKLYSLDDKAPLPLGAIMIL